MNWPKEYGGRGASVMQRVIFRAELSRLDLAEPGIGMGISLLGPTLMHWEDRRAKATSPPGSSRRQRNLVSGLQRTRLRIGPRLGQDPGDRRR